MSGKSSTSELFYRKVQQVYPKIKLCVISFARYRFKGEKSDEDDIAKYIQKKIGNNNMQK